MSFADNLKKARTKRGLTQQELATKAGLSVSSIVNYERGHRKNPPSSILLRISTALDVSLSELAGNTEIMPQPILRKLFADAWNIPLDQLPEGFLTLEPHRANLKDFETLKMLVNLEMAESESFRDIVRWTYMMSEDGREELFHFIALISQTAWGLQPEFAFKDDERPKSLHEELAAYLPTKQDVHAASAHNIQEVPAADASPTEEK